MRHWPALDIPDPDDLLLVALDDFAPTAIEEREPGIRVFFATREQRDSARATLSQRQSATVALEISDEDWAVRSQQNLTPIIVGRIRVVPDPGMLKVADRLFPLGHPAVHAAVHPTVSPDAFDIVIEPSMGFGTGHHATTRLCLAAIQTMELRGVSALDVGTGSGILAIAAARLGAADVHGIDCDADAIQSANQNLTLNPDARHVAFTVRDLAADALPRADLVMANLTGSVLVRSAARLLAATNAGGTLVLSGILAGEEADVVYAFSSAVLRSRQQDDEWVCLTLKKV